MIAKLFRQLGLELGARSWHRNIGEVFPPQPPKKTAVPARHPDFVAHPDLLQAIRTVAAFGARAEPKQAGFISTATHAHAAKGLEVKVYYQCLADTGAVEQTCYRVYRAGKVPLLKDLVFSAQEDRDEQLIIDVGQLGDWQRVLRSMASSAVQPEVKRDDVGKCLSSYGLPIAPFSL